MEIVTIYDLDNDRELTYMEISNREALITAYVSYELKNRNTWEHTEENYGHLVAKSKTGKSLYIGGYCVTA